MAKILVVSKIFTDEEMIQLQNTHVMPEQIDIIVKNVDTDVYTDDGELLCKFRKGQISKENIDEYYDALAHFTITHPTSNRGNTSGDARSNIKTNSKKYSSIIGFFDRWSPKQKYSFKNMNMALSSLPEVRETFFNTAYPDKYKNAIPLITEIDNLYKSLIPDKYNKQFEKSQQTFFRIGETAFTTATTNINFTTTIHRDKGDDEEGFGNLAVIERGEYSGGETCFPQYGLGIDVRQGDILFMNVHEWHGNLPLHLEDKARRMSVVCYLRKQVWLRSKDMNEEEFTEHIATQRKLNKTTYKKCQARDKLIL